MDNLEIYKKGMRVKLMEELSSLRTQIKALTESLDFQFYRHPIDVELVDLDKVENLTREIVRALREAKQKAREIEELGG